MKKFVTECDRYLLHTGDHLITTPVILNNNAMSLHLFRLMIKANVSISLQLFGQRFPQNSRHKRNVILFIPNASHLTDDHVAPLISLGSVIDQICGSFFTSELPIFLKKFMKKKNTVRIVEFDLR